MNKIVLDASAILALINGEPGHEKLTPALLASAVSSTVNLAEVQAKLVHRGWSPDEAWEDATSPIREAVPFSAEHARIAGSLIALTRPLGLSLGDCACLALGIALKAPIYTADKTWKGLKLNVRIHVIR
ncbi:MAG: type II toxin-antitoxin system VapC family toxin [Terriglobales bacterium]